MVPQLGTVGEVHVRSRVFDDPTSACPMFSSSVVWSRRSQGAQLGAVLSLLCKGSLECEGVSGVLVTTLNSLY